MTLFRHTKAAMLMQWGWSIGKTLLPSHGTEHTPHKWLLTRERAWISCPPLVCPVGTPIKSCLWNRASLNWLIRYCFLNLKSFYSFFFFFSARISLSWMICNRSFIIWSQNTGEYVNMVQRVIQYNIIEKNCILSTTEAANRSSSSFYINIHCWINTSLPIMLCKFTRMCMLISVDTAPFSTSSTCR